MRWEVILLDEVLDWFLELAAREPASAELVAAALDLLEEHGPMLGRPLVDSVAHSSLSNLKELRPGSIGRSEYRILFAFDLARRAVLLVAGDKSGSWSTWYERNVPIAEARMGRWLAGEYAEER